MLAKNSLAPQKIIIIDDNVNIHQDFIKILNSIKKEEPSSLEKALFGQTTPAADIFPEIEIHTAAQGLEGVEKIAEAYSVGIPFSIAFVDIRMPPGLDGIETIKKIYPIDPNIQVVICSAFSDYSWEETTENLGLRDNLLILKKPFDSTEIRQLVCSLAKKTALLSHLQENNDNLSTHLKTNNAKLEQSLSLKRATLESTSDSILIINNERLITDFNSHFCEMFQVSPSLLKLGDKKQILDSILKNLTHPEILIDKLYTLSHYQEEASTAIFSFIDGRMIEQFSLPHLLDGNIVGRIWNFRDVTEKYRLSEKLEYQATHDALTDLPNRLLLYDRIQQTIAQASRHGFKVGVFFLDLDRFKLINDSLSHDAGDELLKAVAKRILTLLREEDTLSRLGGDEFVVLAPSIYKHENLLQIASRLQSAFEQPFEIVGRLLSIHSSIGIAVYPEDGDTAEKLLRNADLAMYASKESGNGQCKFYIKKLNEDALQKLEIENELRLALAQQEFMLYYQPQYNTFTNEITTIEALIRWKHPIKGILESIEFIRDAEESRLIIPIGEWVLKTACLQNKLWQDNGLIHTRIAVNISPQQMKSVFFVDSVKNILKETKLKPEFLELEITENVILSGTKVLQILAQLRELNINITLDDFGSGNSSFSYLRSASIDRIKIDPSFIKNIDINSKDEIMIQSILNITKSMEIDVVAEGVETQDQMTFLKNMSCNEVQGYYYSQPIRAEQLTAILKDQSRQKARK